MSINVYRLSNQIDTSIQCNEFPHFRLYICLRRKRSTLFPKEKKSPYHIFLPRQYYSNFAYKCSARLSVSQRNRTDSNVALCVQWLYQCLKGGFYYSGIYSQTLLFHFSSPYKVHQYLNSPKSFRFRIGIRFRIYVFLLLPSS